jgi:hypothetical protein
MDEEHLYGRMHDILQEKINLGSGRMRRARRSKSRKRSYTRGAGTKKGAAKNPWIKHVMQIRKKVGKNVPYKTVLQIASDCYHPKGGVTVGGISVGGARRITRFANKKCTIPKPLKPKYWMDDYGVCHPYSVRKKALAMEKKRLGKKKTTKKKATKGSKTTKKELMKQLTQCKKLLNTKKKRGAGMCGPMCGSKSCRY